MPVETLNANPFVVKRSIHIAAPPSLLSACRNKLREHNVSLQAFVAEFLETYSEDEPNADAIANNLALRLAKAEIEKHTTKAIEREEREKAGIRLSWSETRARRRKKRGYGKTHFVVSKNVLNKCKKKLVTSDVPLQTLVVELLQLYVDNNHDAKTIVKRLAKRFAKVDTERFKDPARMLALGEINRMVKEDSVDHDTMYHLIEDNDDSLENNLKFGRKA